MSRIALTPWLTLLALALPAFGQKTDPVSAPPEASAEAAFIARAKTSHGAFGERAAKHLVAGMPARDRGVIDGNRLWTELDLSMRARAEFPWSAAVPEAIWFEGVLPYANLDEPRHPWRAELLEKTRPLVREAETLTEAAQAINRQLFNLVNVHYSRARKRANQSPQESIEQGKASCTGLSILLVNACRAVGVPARVVGVGNWVDKRGNHTWVEIWDQGWHFTGADEYDAKGLNRGWFTGDAAQAKAEVYEHAVHAAAWAPTGISFPLAWNRRDRSVPAVNVTARYTKADARAERLLAVRLLDRPGGERIVATLHLLDAEGKRVASATTRAGRADWNDLATVPITGPGQHQVSITLGQETRRAKVRTGDEAFAVVDLIWTELPKTD